MKSYKERTEKVMEKVKIQKRKRRKIAALCSLAVCAVLLLAFNLTLFVPYTIGAYTVDISPYKNSEYYSVIQTVSGLVDRSSKGYKTNNFEQWFAFKSMDDAPGEALPPPTAEGGNFVTVPDSSGNQSGSGHYGDANYNPSAPDQSGNGNYEEVTDNQAAGVIEGDLFKRSDKYIFYLNLNPIYDSKYSNHYSLEVYSIAGKDSQKVSSFKIIPEENTYFNHYTNGFEIFLNSDCTAVTVVAPVYAGVNRTSYTMVLGVDVSDVKNMREIGRSYVSGYYNTSRTVGGSLLLVSNFRVGYRPDYSDESQFLPQAGKWGELKSLPVKDIVCPENANSASYTVVSSFDEKTFEITDCVALLSFSSDIYVSADNLYATRTINSDTEIRRISYGGGELEIKEVTSVKGTVLNRYCMDEYKGVLRVVTMVGGGRLSQTASLYCLNVETFTQIAAVEEFAPLGEQVRSARFYGDIAYVCTSETNAVKNTDPVFAFDLSNYQNITYKDTGTIPGYSLSLTAFKDGTLVGVGYGEWNSTLKEEVYEETDSNVASVAEYTLENTLFSQNYKAYFIDKESGLVGLAVWNRNKYEYSYLVLWFDGYKLVELKTDIILDGTYSVNSDNVRACRVDDYLYVLSENSFHAVKLGEIEYESGK